MPITRRFLGWERPVLDLVADHLLSAANGPILDLSHLLVIVPTRNAGRRLREMLAHLADLRATAICPPQVVPPEFLLGLVSHPEIAEGRLATPAESQLAWLLVLRAIDPDEFRALFPVPPVRQKLAWALATAKGLMDLRHALGEAGLSAADVTRLFSGELEEEDRWRELARLERRHQQTLRSHGTLDLLAVRQVRSLTPDIPPGITGILLAGVPDPIPLAVDILGALGSLLPLDILIHAPEALAGDFDAWGRPVADAWLHWVIRFPGDGFPVHVLPDPSAEAERAARAVLATPEPASTITVGVLDDEVFPPLERLLDAGGQDTFNPRGSSLRSRGILHLLRTLRNLLERESFADFLELLRCPDYEAYLASTVLGWESQRAFERFDQLHRRHLVQDLRTLRGLLRPGARPEPPVPLCVEQVVALEETDKLLERLSRLPLADSVAQVLETILGSRQPTRDDGSDLARLTAAEAIQPVLEALSGPFGHQLSLTSPEVLDLLVHTLEQETLYEERPAGSVELLGWLELHWDDAPHLVVTGFNDGFAPESVVGDVYFPESLRRRIAARMPFPTNESRLARDIYLLQAILESRGSHGRVDLLLAKHSQDGNPLRPSRLLFRCPDEELPGRVDHLFHSVPPPPHSPPWTPGFLLRPRGGHPVPESLPVTAFRDYLSSPFHFYLRHLEKMQPVDGEARELDGAGFGTFCHEVMARFGQDHTVRHETDPNRIRDFLIAAAGSLARQQFGDAPPLAVRLQIESALRRLTRAAEIQAETRREGWIIAHTETELGKEAPFLVDGVTIRGRIDRIDRHEKTGVIRIVDYKTSDQPASPRKAHLTELRANSRTEGLADHARFFLGNTECRWTDLQLPLYRLGLSADLGNRIECAYFNLPKDVTGTSIQVWDDLTEEHDAAALRCAQGIIGDIRAGRFWPAPAARDQDSTYFRLHLGLPELTIDPSELLPDPS